MLLAILKIEKASFISNRL